MRIVVIALVLLALFPVPGRSAPPSDPAIVDIQGTVHGRDARVRFTLKNAFTPEMVEALKSGIEISFKTVVRVERVHRNWFDSTLGEAAFSRSVRYDALARVYRLHRGGGEELLPDILTALERMTRYDVTVPLSDDTMGGRKYRALVNTRLDKVGLSETLRSIFFFSSLWDVETGWGRGELLPQ